MNLLDDIKLNEYESEEIDDVIRKLEKSFAINFENDAFTHVKTFGELCDVIESYIKYDNKEDCTKQQAFYKIRAAISESQLIDKGQITLDTKLADLFPRQNRRQQVKTFQKKLGFNIEMLTMSGWLALTLIGGFIVSVIAIFFEWKIGVSGIAFFIIATKVADKLGKELALETVKELTEKAALEHYISVRSSSLTVNRNEILDTIKDAFSTDLLIEKEKLTRDEKFSWA